MSDNSNAIWLEGLKRAFVASMIAMLLQIGNALANPAADVRTIVGVALVAFAGGMLSRIGEAGFDVIREKNGQVIPSDVGHSTISSVVTLPINQPVTVTPPEPATTTTTTVTTNPEANASA